LGRFGATVELDRVFARRETLRQLVHAFGRDQLWLDCAIDNDRVFLPASELDGGAGASEANDRSRAGPCELRHGGVTGIDAADVMHGGHTANACRACTRPNSAASLSVVR